MNQVPDYESPYAIQHPVRSRYDRLLGALSDAAKADASISQGLGIPGAGRDFMVDMRDALIDASLLEAEIVGGYFKDDDFLKVYPDFTPATVFFDVSHEVATLNILNERRVTIKEVCEINKWFEVLPGEIIPTSQRFAKEQPPVKGLPATLPRDSSGQTRTS